MEEQQSNDGHAVAVSVLDDEPEPDAAEEDKGDRAAPEIPLAARLKEIVLTMLPIGVYGVGAYAVG